MAEDESVTDAAPVSATDYQALAAFRRALRHFTAFSEVAAAGEGLPPQQHQALLAIKGRLEDEPMSLSDLAASLVVRHNTAVELCDRLEASGLIVRQPSAHDRRRMALSLTPKAEALLQRLSAAHLEELRRITPLLIELLQRFQPQELV